MLLIIPFIFGNEENNHYNWSHQREVRMNAIHAYHFIFIWFRMFTCRFYSLLFLFDFSFECPLKIFAMWKYRKLSCPFESFKFCGMSRIYLMSLQKSTRIQQNENNLVLFYFWIYFINFHNVWLFSVFTKYYLLKIKIKENYF